MFLYCACIHQILSSVPNDVSVFVVLNGTGTPADHAPLSKTRIRQRKEANASNAAHSVYDSAAVTDLNGIFTAQS